MGYGGYPFWLKNRADSASARASDAQNEARNERVAKEETQERLENIEKVIKELKAMLEQGHAEGSIKTELFDLIKGKLEKITIK